MTAGTRLGRYGSDSARSVRQRLGAPGRIGWALLALVAAAVAVHGFRGLLPVYPGGDLLYHWGLTHGLLRGEFPPGGPYEGLPAYYPPGFHIMVAVIAAAFRTTAETATSLLGLVWLPILPLSTFLLARYVTGRPGVALLATALTVFGGAYDFSADRLWVNSWFLVGHEAYPLYPRDVVFGLLPLAVYSYLRALEGPRSLRWAAIAGLLLGVCGLVQVQLLLPLPFALGAATIAVALRRPEHRAKVVAVVGLTGAATMLLVGPWLIDITGTIRLNGGVALESAETLLPARVDIWDIPRQFGLFVPFAIVGSALVLATARERDQHVGWLSPRLPETPLLLVPWFAIPFVLAFMYDPGWPLDDALRPQRLWLLSSQPAAILAAIGVTLAADRLVAGRLQRPRLVGPLLAIFLVLATVPATFFTARLLADSWTEPQYAHLRLDRDRVPDMASILGTDGPRNTVLTYEDWSSLAWYQTGVWVVALNPPGYAKLAFDPGIFTGHSQAQRRADVGRAFEGTASALASVASEYGAKHILLARRGDAWGTIHQVASTTARDDAATDGMSRIVDGNGWDVVELSTGSSLAFSIASDAAVDLELRFRGAAEDNSLPDRAFRLLAIGPAGERPLGDYVVPATDVDGWQVVTAVVDVRAGERMAIEAIDPVMIQSILGFAPSSPPPGWRVARESADTILLEPDR